MTEFFATAQSSGDSIESLPQSVSESSDTIADVSRKAPGPTDAALKIVLVLAAIVGAVCLICFFSTCSNFQHANEVVPLNSSMHPSALAPLANP